MKRLLLFLFGLTLCSSVNAEILKPERIYAWKGWEGPGTTNQTVGVRGGIPGTPGGPAQRETIFVNLLTTLNTDYKCTGLDDSDDSAHLRNALEDCPEGQVVYAPAGTYRFGFSASPGENIRDNITLRGEMSAPDVNGVRTHLTIFKGNATVGGVILNLGNIDAPANFEAITGGDTRGSSTLTVVSTAAFTVGENVQIIVTTEDNPEFSYVHNLFPGTSGGTYTHSMGMVVKIVSKTGTTMAIDPPLPLDLHGLGVLATMGSTTVRGIGIEDILFEGSTQGATGFFIHLKNAEGCWFKNLVMQHAPQGQAHLDGVINSEVRRCQFLDGAGGGPGNEGLDFTDRSCFNLVEDNIFKHVGIPQLVFGDSGHFNTGNVAGYNYFNADANSGNPDIAAADFSFAHSSHSMFILFEGNVCGMIQGGDGHSGSASHNSVVRNRIGVTHQTATTYIRGIEFDHYTNFSNIMGNSLGVPEFDMVFSIEERNYNHSIRPVYRFGYFYLGQDCYGLYPTADENCPPCGVELEGPAFDVCTNNTDVGCRNIIVASIPPALPDYRNEPFDTGSCGVSGAIRIDLNVKKTTAVHGNWDKVTNGIVWEDNNDNVTDFTDQTIPTSLYTTQGGLVARGVVMGALELPMIGPEPYGSYTNDNNEMLNAAAYRWANGGADPPSEPVAPILYFIPSS